MEFFITSLYTTLQSPYFLLAVLSFSVAVKGHYIYHLAPRLVAQYFAPMQLTFLFSAIVSALFCDISWFISLTQSLFIPFSYSIVVFFIRIAWAFLILQYFSLSLFLESLTTAKFRFKKIHTPLAALSTIFSSYFLYLAFFTPFTLATQIERDIARETINSFEFFVMRYVVVYLIGAFIAVGLYNAYMNIQTRKLPVILDQQLRTFASFLIFPYLIMEFILGFSFKVIYEMHFLISISTLLLSLAIYYCLHKVIKLRFMDTASRVQAQPNPEVIDNFKQVLDHLSDAKSLEELTHITQAFFKETFKLPSKAVDLIIRDMQADEASSDSEKIALIESFIHAHTHNAEYEEYKSILVYDEIAYNHFYQESIHTNKILTFLDSIDAAILLPIYSKNDLVAYITIKKNIRPECYNHAEQDAMSAYASYLGNVINLLHHKSLSTLISKEKKLKDQLYTTHQEINQYKESVHSFLRRSKAKELGIVFYKNGQFINANQDAKKIVSIDLNKQEGHPLTQAFNHVAQYVQTYKSTYTHYTHDTYGNPLLLSGVPHIKQQSIIITVAYPEISDVILQQIHLLNNPNDWDYLLYLNSTRAGRLINELIPAGGDIMLNLKISLLKAALNKKTLLIEAPDADLPSIVELVHTISGRDQLHTIELNKQINGPDVAVALFGDTIVNPHRQPLLQRFGMGTICIKNAHYLDVTTQEHLVEYIKYGMYRIYNSDQKVNSNARIICCTNQSMVQLMQQGNFNPELFKLLKQAILSVPSMVTIPQEELLDLIDGYTDKIINSHALKNLFALSEKEKQKIIAHPPSSMKELRLRVEQQILHKSEESFLAQEQPLSELDDPDLMQAGRLGKQALKDPQLMQKLWDKFKNQNKIALFLGVNRSSVNRRFKLFEIGQEHEGVA